MKKRIGVPVAVLAGLALGAFGCASHMAKSAPSAVSPQKAVTAPSAGPGEEAQEPSLRNNVLHEIAGVQTIHFDYDSSALTGESRAVLADNSAWLKEHSEAKVQVAGHCDQRGTEEYNLALGQRRAKVVRSYYMELGVPGGRIATISYGKDKPLCAEQEESCWAKNRRAETLIALPETISSTPKTRP